MSFAAPSPWSSPQMVDPRASASGLTNALKTILSTYFMQTSVNTTSVLADGPTTSRFLISSPWHRFHIPSQPLPQLLLKRMITVVGTSHVVSSRDTKRSHAVGHSARFEHQRATGGSSAALTKVSRTGAARCTSSTGAAAFCPRMLSSVGTEKDHA